MSGESVSTYPRRPKAKAFSNAVDVVERLHDPTDPSTERTAPPCLAHVQQDDVPQESADRSPEESGEGTSRPQKTCVKGRGGSALPLEHYVGFPLKRKG